MENTNRDSSYSLLFVKKFDEEDFLLYFLRRMTLYLKIFNTLLQVRVGK